MCVSWLGFRGESTSCSLLVAGAACTCWLLSFPSIIKWIIQPLLPSPSTSCLPLMRTSVMTDIPWLTMVSFTIFLLYDGVKAICIWEKSWCCFCWVTLVQLFMIPWTAVFQVPLSFTVSLEFALNHVHWISDVIQPFHPLSPSSPAFNLSHHQGLSQWVSFLHQVPKYWSFSFSTTPSSEYSGLISFKIDFDWFDLLAVQGTLKSLV